MQRTLFLLGCILSIAILKAQQTEIRAAKITFGFPYKNVQGSIGGFQSSSKIDWNDLSNSTFIGSVTVATLDTNNGLRNWSLRSSRYFNAKEYPAISFESREIQETGKGNWSVTGGLTIKGTTKDFQIDFKKVGEKLVGNASLYSSDFGINIKKKREDNLVKVMFEFELVP